MSYIHLINESNKLSLNKPANADRVYYSELLEWFTNNAFRSFSIKFVVQGTIYYRCKYKEYKVQQDHFLLTSKQSGAQAYFDSNQPVKSICIDICPTSLAEAYTILHSKGELDLDNFMAGYFDHPYFFEHVYKVQESLFGKQLQRLSNTLNNGRYHPEMINEEWFLELVELIILQEKGNYLSLNNIPAKKPATRKEIYERLLKGKEYMDAYYSLNPDIATVAQNCNLSTFHFFRSFRQAFEISPYQYMMQLRLKYSLKLMREESYSLTDIATFCGFPDLFTFSKAFKREYGVSPSRYKVSSNLQGFKA
jgi:AraC family transcriptional regulator